jgi:hypothetical protein
LSVAALLSDNDLEDFSLIDLNYSL